MIGETHDLSILYDCMHRVHAVTLFNYFRFKSNVICCYSYSHTLRLIVHPDRVKESIAGFDQWSLTQTRHNLLDDLRIRFEPPQKAWPGVLPQNAYHFRGGVFHLNIPWSHQCFAVVFWFSVCAVIESFVHRNRPRSPPSTNSFHGRLCSPIQIVYKVHRFHFRSSEAKESNYWYGSVTSGLSLALSPFGNMFELSFCGHITYLMLEIISCIMMQCQFDVVIFEQIFTKSIRIERRNTLYEVANHSFPICGRQIALMPTLFLSLRWTVHCSLHFVSWPVSLCIQWAVYCIDLMIYFRSQGIKTLERLCHLKRTNIFPNNINGTRSRDIPFIILLFHCWMRPMNSSTDSMKTLTVKLVVVNGSKSYREQNRLVRISLIRHFSVRVSFSTFVHHRLLFELPLNPTTGISLWRKSMQTHGSCFQLFMSKQVSE